MFRPVRLTDIPMPCFVTLDIQTYQDVATHFEVPVDTIVLEIVTIMPDLPESKHYVNWHNSDVDFANDDIYVQPRLMSIAEWDTTFGQDAKDACLTSLIQRGYPYQAARQFYSSEHPAPGYYTSDDIITLHPMATENSIIPSMITVTSAASSGATSSTIIELPDSD